MPDIEIPDYFSPNPKRQQEMEGFIRWFKHSWTYLIIILLLFFVFTGALIKVDAGERAVLFNVFGGIEKKVLGEGIHFVLPFIQRATIYDIKQTTYNFASEDQIKQGKLAGTEIHSLTSDGQRVDIELSVRARPIPHELWKLHRLIGPQYASKIIFPKARTVLRETLANYPVEDVYSVKRQEIQDKVQEKLSYDLAKKYFVEVEEILIRNVRFSKEFQDAIDRKQQAYQEYLRMEYVVSAERTKRDSKILQAEGEASAITQRVNALRANPDIIKYKRAQVFGKRARLIFSDGLN